jgi:hypothetical protein
MGKLALFLTTLFSLLALAGCGDERIPEGALAALKQAYSLKDDSLYQTEIQKTKDFSAGAAQK